MEKRDEKRRGEENERHFLMFVGMSGCNGSISTDWTSKLILKRDASTANMG
jgi:hypothetical protein